MADPNITAARPGLTPTIWDDQYFSEYVRTNQFSRYFGTSMDSMIQLKDDLTRKNGDSCRLCDCPPSHRSRRNWQHDPRGQ